MSISRYAPVAPGESLRGDVAAAFLRAEAAGKPKGGIDVYGRTLAEQKWLHEHQPPVAAPPSFHAPHVDRRAFDTQTTRNGRYTPSAAHVWLTKGGDGSSKPKSGEKIRANEFGFRRSVPSERWHFEYDRKLDKHRASALAKELFDRGFKDLKQFQKAVGLIPDGIDGPFTWSALLADPLIITVPPIVLPTLEDLFRFASYNAQLKRFGGGKYELDAAFVDDVLRPSVLAGQEMDVAARNEIVAATGFKVYPLNTVAIFFSPSKYTWGPRIVLDLNTNYHGLIATKLVSKENDNDFVAGSAHIRPRDAFSSDEAARKGKRDDVKKIIAKLDKYPLVSVGGDWNIDAKPLFEAEGFKLASPYVDTLDNKGVQHYDGVFVKGLPVRGGSVTPTSASDHHGVLANLTIPAPVSTN